MPLDDGDLITCREGVLEVTASLRASEQDSPAVLAESVSERLRAHRHLLMTDPDLLEDDLRVASVVASRSELEPEAIQTFERLGLGREESDTGGRRRGLFGRRRAAVRLERFVLQYARARDLSAPLGVFEDEIPAREDEDDPSSVAEGAGLVIEAARAAWSIQLSVDAESVEALERALALRAQPPTVLAPRVVRSIADFVAQVLLETYPGAEIDPEDVPRLLLPRPSGLPWTTDPEARVIEHVRRGPRASLAGYLRELMTTPPT